MVLLFPCVGSIYHAYLLICCFQGKSSIWMSPLRGSRPFSCCLQASTPLLSLFSTEVFPITKGEGHCLPSTSQFYLSSCLSSPPPFTIWQFFSAGGRVEICAEIGATIYRSFRQFPLPGDCTLCIPLHWTFFGCAATLGSVFIES